MTEAFKKSVRACIRSAPFNGIMTSMLSPLSRLKLLPSSWLITHFPRIGIVQATMPGGAALKLRSDFGDDPIANQVLWRGWDASETEAIRLFYRLSQQAETVLDIGGFVGYFSLVAALANPKSRVYCFEPVPELQERIRANIALNQLSDRITCIAAAVGAAEASTAFYRGGDAMPTCSSLSKSYAVANCPIVKEIPVAVVQLDAWAKKQGMSKIDLVKIDVETGEPQVLEGMVGLLESSSPDILCEVLHTENTAAKLEALLKPHHYRFFLVTDKGPKERRSIVPDSRWRNYLFSKRMKWD